MKTLLENLKLPKTSLYESLLDDFDDIDKSFDPKQIIKDWIKNNYKQATLLKISNKPNSDGKFEVSANKVIVYNQALTSLTNNMFVWKKVDSFNCSDCISLISLKGAPNEVSGNFYCNYCTSLTSLEGAPEKVGGDFRCHDCESLTSLEGAPKEVAGCFYCYNCNSLTSLKGAPKEVGIDFDCSGCKFTRSDIKKISKVKRQIVV